jgi:SAM-dependent methyltransferase
MPGRLEPFEPWLPPRLTQFLRRQAQRWHGRRSPRAGEPLPTFAPEEIDAISELFCTVGTAPGGPWDRLRHAHMPLPDWFRQGLDPWGAEYRAQQERLWQLITGVNRPYSAEADESEVYGEGVDAIRQPAYYMRRDVEAIGSASDHVLATGMLLKHSGLLAGDLALEYGAGFGQTALALARLGVHVDTVDISRGFCRWVQEQADFFRVPLKAHQGPFGFNPRPGQHYKLIWFYESFHHCWDFERVVPLLAAMLADGGRVILGGEPVFEQPYAAVPYPWGVRLHSEVAAVMRRTRWMELGFTEAFLFELFARSGFSGRRVDCEPSLFGKLYIFERPPRPRPGAAATRWDFSSGRLHTQVGVVEGSEVVANGVAGFLAYGPYEPVAAGDGWAEVRFDPKAAHGGRVLVEVVSTHGQTVHSARWFDLGAVTEPTLWLSFTLTEPVDALQVRVTTEAPTRARLMSVGWTHDDNARGLAGKVPSE